MQLHSLITSDGVRVGVLEWIPKDKRFPYPVLLVHGYAQNNLSWHGRNSGIAPSLSQNGFHTFAIDLRGSGYSKLSKLRYDYTFDDFVFKDVEEAVQFLKAKTRSQKVVLAGHSLGGIVSLAYASQKPENVFAIITFGSPIYFGRGVPVMKFFGNLYASISKLPVSKIIPLIWYRENFMKILGFFGLFGVPLMLNKKILKISPLYPSYTRNFESPYDFWEKLVKGFDTTSPKLLFQILRWIYEEKITSYDGKINFTDEFKKIAQPVFIIAGVLDKLAPPESVKPVLDIVSSQVKFYKEYEAGHLDLIEGKLAKTQILRDVVDFLFGLISS
jgi:pimeloyl-ACP methyl ester carboxylesterase